MSKNAPSPGGVVVLIYIFLFGDVPLNRVSFLGFQLRDKVHICHFDSETSDGNVFTSFDRFLTNFLGRAQISLEKLKNRVLVKKALLRDRVSFSGV